ncbi:MAG: S-layer homology domain-containing protein [Oscillospiraceae bacterium]|nr:S-layer homology domain-containing protein [Oscillospiraceae bacterium]
MTKRFLTSVFSLILAMALTLSAAATNQVRYAGTQRTERVPLKNTDTNNSTSYQMFSDVSDTYWGKDGISYVVDKGLFNGTGYGMFSPEMPMNRAMICTVLYRFAGSPAVSGSSGYTDVPSGTWYSDGVAWAKQNEVLTLDLLNSSKLEPDRGLTRGEFSVMMRNFYEVMGGTPYNDSMNGTAAMFPDLQTCDTVTIMAISWLYTYSVLNGTGNKTMSPDMGLTRSQMAAILERYDRQFGSSDASSVGSSGASTFQPAETGSDEEEEEKLINLINDYREANGLRRLNRNEKLMEVADVRAEEISENFTHVRPDGSYIGILYEFDAEDLRADYECITSCVFNAQDAFDSWRKSPGHNGIMLNRDDDIAEIGVSFTRDGGYGVLLIGHYWM